MEWQRTVPADALEDGHPVEVEVAGEPVLLVRQGDRLYATAALCPHKFADLTKGALGDGCLTCPQHEATFDLRTGAADEAWAGWLPVYAVRVADGCVEVAPTSASPSP